MNKIAVLLTCYNRLKKTECCLQSFFAAIQSVEEASFTVFMIDDGSTDGTAEQIKSAFPEVRVTKSPGNLFWAGGMRLAWKEALRSGETFDAFLLINDDVEFTSSFWNPIVSSQAYCLKKYGREGIYVSSTIDKNTR